MLEIVPVPVLRDNYVWLVHDIASGETVVTVGGDELYGAETGVQGEER